MAKVWSVPSFVSSTFCRSLNPCTNRVRANPVASHPDHLERAGPKETSCRIALNRLEQRGVIELPVAREVSFAPSSPKPEEPVPQWLQLKAPLSRLGEVELVLVNGDREL